MSDEHYRWKTDPSDPTSPNYWPAVDWSKREPPQPPPEEWDRHAVDNLPGWAILPSCVAGCLAFIYLLGDRVLALALGLAAIAVGLLWLAVSRRR